MTDVEKNTYLDRLKETQSWYDPDYVPIPKPVDWRPEVKFREDHKWAGHPRCLEWSGRTGKQCGSLPTKGKEKCRHHRGNSASGVDHYKYKHGRYTKAVSSNPTIAKAYEEALKQQGILNLSPNIAMTDARLTLLYQDDIYLTDELIDLANNLLIIWQELKEFIPRSNPSTVERIIQFDTTIKHFTNALQAKNAFDKREDQLTERRRKLTETETKRQTTQAEVVLKAEAIGIFAIMGNLFREIVMNEVEDRQTAQRVIKGQSEVIDTHIVNFFSTDKKE